MTIIYLKAGDESAFNQACVDAGLIDDDGLIKTATSDYFLHIIGKVLTQSEELEEIDGYHANLVILTDGFETGIEHLAIDVDTPMFTMA